jgi:SAM-dependent methyltransferase
VAPGTAVVDLGCGTGNHALAMRARGLRVVGIDSSPGMLKHAARKGIRLARADLGALPFPDAALGAALSVYSAQFFALPAYFAEIRRTLRRDATLVVVLPRRSWSRPRPDLSLRFRAFQHVKNVVAAVGERAGRVHLYEPADMHAALERAGFAVIDNRSTDRNFSAMAKAT